MATPDALRLLALLCLVVPAAAIDLRTRRIPNRLTAAGAVAAILLTAASDPAVLPERLLAALGTGGVLLLAAVANPEGMGLGDVKLTAAIALLLGPPVALALLIALTSAAVAGTARAARGATSWRTTTVPLAPFLALGALAAFAAT